MALGAATAYTTPVGYMTIPLPGTGISGETQALQLGNQGLLPSGPAYASGGTSVTFGSDINGHYLQDTTGTWTAGTYVNGSQVSHLVEITSAGSLLGAMTWIKSSDTQKLYLTDDLSAAGAGASYRVWPAFTMSSLFGNPPTSSVLGTAADPATADDVEIYDPVADKYTLFYYRAASKGLQGWQCDDAGVTSPATYAIHPNDGLVILRKQSADGSLVVSGSVKSGQTMVRVDGDVSRTTLNILANQIPVDQLTPSNSGLYTGNGTTGLQAAADPATADNLLIFDAASNAYKLFYYRIASKGLQGWQCDDSNVTDPANYVIPATGALLIQRKSAASFNWTVPAVNIAQ